MKLFLTQFLAYIKEEKRLIFNILCAFVIKGCSLLVSTFSLPLYIGFFDNNETLGLWYTILSVLNWINMCDIGLGNGLRNKLTECLSKKEYVLASKYISSTYVMLFLIILPVLFVGCTMICFMDVNQFFNISQDIIDRSILREALIILLLGVGINFVLRTINSVIYALQIPFVNNVISLVPSIIPVTFVVMYESVSINEGLIMLSWVHIIAINLPLMLASLLIFKSRKTQDYKPGIRNIDLGIAKATASLGVKFFVAQIFFMILMSTNELFISKFYSPENVIEYNIYYKLFMVVGSLFMIMLTPVWSKVTKDLAEKRYSKIKKTNHILYGISLIAIIAEFSLIPVLQFIINIWLGEETITVNYSIATIFAIFGSLYISNIVLTTVSNGIGELKTQMLFYGIGAILKIPVTAILKANGIGWWGIVAYNSIILLMFCICQIIWIENRINTLLQSKNGLN